MSNPSLLLAKDLMKAFGEDRPAVDNVSLQLTEKESLAIIGPSGAGKSTLLRLLAGLESPDSGSILLDGHRLEDPVEQLVRGNKDIRMVHQDFGLAANRTVYGNVDMLLRRYQTDYRQQETRRLLEAVKLTPIADHAVATLSGGEKQRLGLARALADDSRLVLLDEPFSQQDALLKAHLYEVIYDEIRIADKGMILVTHDPREAMALADRVAVMITGKIEQEGSPSELYDHPHSPDVASLTGRINLMTAAQWSAISIGHSLPTNGEQIVGYRPEDLRVEPSQESAFTIRRLV
ncbi:MAG: ABC transporter ATP-binding protein [Cyclobacteriaceae bacterium]